MVSTLGICLKKKGKFPSQIPKLMCIGIKQTCLIFLTSLG